MTEEVIHLKDVPEDEIPELLKSEYYFDFDAHPFDHAALIRGAPSVIHALDRIHDYIVETIPQIVDDPEPFDTWDEESFEDRSVGAFLVRLEQDAVFEPAYVVGRMDGGEPHTLYVRRGARVLGSNIWLDQGSIVVGAGSTIEPGVGLRGPTILGRKNTLRQGSYFRGDVIVGNACTLRGELKNAVMINSCDFPHPCYVGDSLCGYRSHFGNQATSANLRVLDIVDHKNIRVDIDGRHYDLGRRKVGIVLGDYSQVGCNTVSDPGVFLAPWVICYQLNRLNKGFYGPDKIVKNKPMEHDVLEQAHLRR